MTEVTEILQRIESGDPAAAEQLLPVVYKELRRLAAAKMARALSIRQIPQSSFCRNPSSRLGVERLEDRRLLTTIQSALDSATYLGGSKTEDIKEIFVDQTGDIYMTGRTAVALVPRLEAIDRRRPRRLITLREAEVQPASRL